MKAVVYRSYGGPEKLETAELPTPEPGPGEILVRVCASSVNPVDWKIASGKYWPILRAHLPQVPGFDIAGEVVRCGSGVTGFAPGTRVHACLSQGTVTAGFTLATPELLAPMPAEMDFATAAGLPLAGMTALQGLCNQGGLPLHGASERVLVVGAAGGTGHFAVQIAHAAGATVIGVCSERNRPLVESLGAHQVIDYAAVNPYGKLAACDIILDCVGQPAATWLPHLKPGGRFVSMVPRPGLFIRSLNPMSRKKVKVVVLKANAADLSTLDKLASTGQLRVVAQHFPLEQMRVAWELSISGRTVGKIIIDVANK